MVCTGDLFLLGPIPVPSDSQVVVHHQLLFFEQVLKAHCLKERKAGKKKKKVGCSILNYVYTHSFTFSCNQKYSGMERPSCPSFWLHKNTRDWV